MPARRLEWAVAGGMTCMALARLTGADRWPLTRAQFVALLSFTPQAAAAGWLGAAALRDRKAAALTAAAAAVLTGAVLPRGLPRSQPQAGGPQIRVLTANLLAGRAAAAPLAGLVRAAGVDVLLAQELTTGALGRLADAGLAGLLPHVVSDVGTPGASGNAIYARYPLAADPDLPARSWVRPAVQIKLPSATARLACVHLHTPMPPWSQQGAAQWLGQLRGLTSLPAAGDPPLIMAGDFNATLDHADFRRLLRVGYADAASAAGAGLTPTWSARAGAWPGLLAIDHVLADPRCQVLSTAVHRLPGTDHRALLATIRLP